MEEEDKDNEEVLIPEIVENTKPTGILQDPTTGRFLPGTKNPNTKLDYVPKDPLKKYLRTMFGEEGRDILNYFAEIMYYDPKTAKDRFAKWKPEHKMKAAQILLEYLAGKPVSRIEAEIEQKILQVNLDATPEDLKEEDIE